MKIENQVCAVAQAIRLHELGIIGESVWWHCNDYPNNPSKYPNEWYIIPINDYPYTFRPRRVEKYEDGYHLLPAWSVSELGELLPDKFNYQFSQCFVDSVKYCKEYKWIAGIHTVWAHNKPVVAKKYFPGDNEAEIRAEVLIHLLETNHITPEDCNKRLLEA